MIEVILVILVVIIMIGLTCINDKLKVIVDYIESKTKEELK